MNNYEIDYPDATNGKVQKPRELISFVIPIKDERETLIELFQGIQRHVPEEYDFEVILIDDGSDDDSWLVVSSLADVYPEYVRGLRFRSNKGKACGLTAGYRAAKGDIVFTMDADLQDDPAEIPRFLAKLKEGYGLVSGWKQVRHDPWHKVLPSRVFNWLLSRVTGVKLHDHNCGFKCYRGSLARELTLHGELHRMVPALAATKGYRVTEIVVAHHPRRCGSSKYGIERFLRGFSDMLTVGFQRRFAERPSHFINGIALCYLFIGSIFIGSMMAATLWQFESIIGVGGWVTLGVSAAIFLAMSLATFVAGQISELVIRGGLQSSYSLPVVEDTAELHVHRNGIRFEPVPHEFQPPRVTESELPKATYASEEYQREEDFLAT